MLMFRVGWLETSLSCFLNSCKSVSVISLFILFTNICFLFFSFFSFSYLSDMFIYFWILWFQNLQSFLAGLAASGAITSGLRLITKAAFENSRDGFRKGASMFKFPYFFNCLLLIIALYYTYYMYKMKNSCKCFYTGFLSIM